MKTQALDDPQQIRRAGRELLSLALMDARNHLLRLLALDESTPALRLAAHAGWYQDHWICRHVQRQRGEACDPRGTRLAGIEPQADGWIFANTELPSPAGLRSYLRETLEITLDLLAAAAEDDAGLYFYRQSLLHEDRLCETLAQRLLLATPPARTERQPLWLPAQRWLLGSPPGVPVPGSPQGGLVPGSPQGGLAPGSPHAGLVPGSLPTGLVPYNERWAHEVAVPEFEIDAQPVNWARYVEFAGDGGYDRSELWSDTGWAWLQAQGRRAPLHVEQLHGGVLVQRRAGGTIGLQRVPAAQPVSHVARFEAEAWCRWAGRRLPTEPEWELAASAGASRGFVWGDVFEWVAGSARAWPGAGAAAPGCLDFVPARGTQGVLRGASCLTRRRWAHPKARRFAPPACDTLVGGFRSCAL